MRPAIALTQRGDAAAIRRSVRIQRPEAGQLVAGILKHICRALSQGEDVKIVRLGTFHVPQKPTRLGRNVRTGEEVIILARRVLTFGACDAIRRRVAKGLEGQG